MSTLDLVDVAAYIDAGTGSYLLAAIASGAAGLWMFLRSGMARMRRKVRGESAPSEEIAEADDTIVASIETESPEEQPARD